MPIRPENRSLYPRQWHMITRIVRWRAAGRCEGSPGVYPDCRAAQYDPHPVTGSKVILTVAHLNHDPADCRWTNLRAMCQRCHLTYDAPMKARSRRERRSIESGQIEMWANKKENA